MTPEEIAAMYFNPGATRDLLAHHIRAAVEAERAENKDTRLALAAIVHDLGGEIIIPLRSLREASDLMWSADVVTGEITITAQPPADTQAERPGGPLP